MQANNVTIIPSLYIVSLVVRVLVMMILMMMVPLVLILMTTAASEPNLLKIRLKQSVIERKARAGPWTAKRQERLQAAQRRQQQKHNATLASATATSASSAAGTTSEYLSSTPLLSPRMSVSGVGGGG